MSADHEQSIKVIRRRVTVATHSVDAHKWLEAVAAGEDEIMDGADWVPPIRKLGGYRVREYRGSYFAYGTSPQVLLDIIKQDNFPRARHSRGAAGVAINHRNYNGILDGDAPKDPLRVPTKKAPRSKFS